MIPKKQHTCTMLFLFLPTLIVGQVDYNITLLYFLLCSAQDTIKGLSSIRSDNYDAAGVLGTEDVVVKYVSLAQDPVGKT